MNLYLQVLDLQHCVCPVRLGSSFSVSSPPTSSSPPFLVPLESAKLVPALGLWHMFSLPGTFFPSPFPVLPDLGMAAPYCSSSSATSLEGHSLTALSKASPLPHAPYPALLHLGSFSKPQNGRWPSDCFSTLPTSTVFDAQEYS